MYGRRFRISDEAKIGITIVLAMAAFIPATTSLITTQGDLAFSTTAHADKIPSVVTILYPPTDCETDFDMDFWAKYDSAMTEEWRIQSQTLCLDQLTIPEKLSLTTDLQSVGLNVITMLDDNASIPIGQNGLARPLSNYGTIEFNYRDTPKTLSHETLHLTLEELGYSQICFVDKVHESAYKFARYYDDVMIVKYFECGAFGS